MKVPVKLSSQSRFEHVVVRSHEPAGAVVVEQVLQDDWMSAPHSKLNAKALRGVGAPILYLDYDGVLHHENVLWHPRRGIFAGPPGFTLFEHAVILEKLLAPFPQVNIVLSTSWVRTCGFHRAVKRLPDGLRGRVLGATFHSHMNERAFVARPRGQQVLSDVSRRRPLDWLALDDTDEGWPVDVRERVLITDERLGISAPGMHQLITAALERLCEPKSQ